ncbi:MAG TPA: hypothetical protein VGN23_17280 [Verrucomicrobiae bacterium]|jgi:uncharacterized protein YggT (Ycf19 family)
MGIVDFILNLAALLLWLNWRAEKADPVGKRRPATLIGTLRRPESRSANWLIPMVIAGLIVLRAFLYHLIGGEANWSAGLNLGVIELSFRGAHFSQMLVYSLVSFIQTLWVFYLWLLLLSILQGPLPFHDFIRIQLGAIDRWSRTTKLLLPFIATSILWWLATWLLEGLKIIPEPLSAVHRISQSLVMGLTSYLTWEFIAVALLIVHLLNSYIYFGKQPFWSYVNAEAQTLLSPLKPIPLRVGKVDFAPVVGIALVFLLAWLAARLLHVLYGHVAV